MREGVQINGGVLGSENNTKALQAEFTENWKRSEVDGFTKLPMMLDVVRVYDVQCCWYCTKTKNSNIIIHIFYYIMYINVSTINMNASRELQNIPEPCTA